MPPVPDWLKARNGELKSSSAWPGAFVYFGQEPQYEVAVVPVKGQFGCRIVQSINGKPIACPGVFATPDEAIRGGLEVLRNYLGW